MKYSDLVESLKEIVALISTVPEKFQERTFEMLLQHLLKQTDESRKPTEMQQPPKGGAIPPAGGSGVQTNVSLKLLMKKYGITQEQLDSVFFVEAGDVHFLREPSTDKAATAQIEWALLLALKNAILQGKFMVDPEDVRSICKDKDVYDLPNFAANFDKKANVGLFKGEMKQQGDPQPLSDEGISELAELIKRLSSKS